MCKLRAHHALCIRFFQGKGYSAAFTDHMSKVVQRLEENDPEVMLLRECDTLCECCPHERDGVCESAEKVRRYDESVLALCHLQPGEILRWSDLKHLADAIILASGRLADVCSDCQWHGLCASSKLSR